MQTLEQFGIGQVVEPLPGHEDWRDWIALPYVNPNGSVRLWRFRRNGDGKPKFMQEPNKGNHMYLVAHTAKPTPVICEGEWDALILAQLGYASCSIPGATNWREPWRYLFAHADYVRICCDGDAPGRDLARAVARSVGLVTETRVIELPDGADVNSLYLREPDRVKELLDG